MNQSEIILYKTEDGAIKIDTISRNKQVVSSILEHTTQRKKYDFIPGGKINA